MVQKARDHAGIIKNPRGQGRCLVSRSMKIRLDEAGEVVCKHAAMFSKNTVPVNSIFTAFQKIAKMLEITND